MDAAIDEAVFARDMAASVGLVGFLKTNLPGVVYIGSNVMTYEPIMSTSDIVRNWPPQVRQKLSQMCVDNKNGDVIILDHNDESDGGSKIYTMSKADAEQLVKNSKVPQLIQPLTDGGDTKVTKGF